MVEVTFLIDDIDYSDRLDSQLPLVFETMSKNQKEKLACKLLSSQREKLMRKMNQLAADYGIVATLKDCRAVQK